MGYVTWSVNGYGTCVEQLRPSLKKVKKLISRAPEFEKELEKYFEDNDITVPTINDYLECDQDNNAGIAYILKRVMGEAENIEFTCAEDYDCNWYLLLCPSYPWYNNTEEEKSLTEKTTREMMKKYISILSDTELEFDYQSVENGG